MLRGLMKGMGGGGSGGGGMAPEEMDPSGGEKEMQEKWKKWEANPDDMLDVEKSLKKLQPTAKDTHKHLTSYLEVQLENARITGNQGKMIAYEKMIATLEKEASEEQFKENYSETFLWWLLGRSGYNVTREDLYLHWKDSTKSAPINVHGQRGALGGAPVQTFEEYLKSLPFNPTPWGNKKLVHLKGVAEYLDKFVDKRKEVEKAITKLTFLGPRNLEEAWVYYKYMIRKNEIDGDDILYFTEFLSPYTAIQKDQLPPGGFYIAGPDENSGEPDELFESVGKFPVPVLPPRFTLYGQSKYLESLQFYADVETADADTDLFQTDWIQNIFSTMDPLERTIVKQQLRTHLLRVGINLYSQKVSGDDDIKATQEQQLKIYNQWATVFPELGEITNETTGVGEVLRRNLEKAAKGLKKAAIKVAKKEEGFGLVDLLYDLEEDGEKIHKKKARDTRFDHLLKGTSPRVDKDELSSAIADSVLGTMGFSTEIKTLEDLSGYIYLLRDKTEELAEIEKKREKLYGDMFHFSITDETRLYNDTLRAFEEGDSANYYNTLEELRTEVKSMQRDPDQVVRKMVNGIKNILPALSRAAAEDETLREFIPYVTETAETRLRTLEDTNRGLKNVTNTFENAYRDALATHALIMEEKKKAEEEKERKKEGKEEEEEEGKEEEEEEEEEGEGGKKSNIIFVEEKKEESEPKRVIKASYKNILNAAELLVEQIHQKMADPEFAKLVGNDRKETLMELAKDPMIADLIKGSMGKTKTFSIHPLDTTNIKSFNKALSDIINDGVRLTVEQTTRGYTESLNRVMPAIIYKALETSYIKPQDFKAQNVVSQVVGKIESLRAGLKQGVLKKKGQYYYNTHGRVNSTRQMMEEETKKILM